ncbi:MAG: DUF4412 domain-containing protein [Deltaproteobacteria bacterium]|nr:DUF4412 domain-containing protein [Deltaproteobacteria bacterium]MBW2121560.1 DUF4412 domain-containing protein [Deltaproteobacteria bacterium]
MNTTRDRLIALGLVALVLSILPAFPAGGGTFIDQDTIDIWGRKQGLVLYYSKGRLRIDQKDGRLSTIMNFAENRIVVLDHLSKSYVEYPLSRWKRRVSQRMKGTGSYQRREVRVEPTGQEKVINGFRTRRIRVMIGGVLFQESWVTRDVELGDMLRAIRKGAGTPSGLSKAQMEEKEEIYEKVSQWGFPILTVEYRILSGKTLTETTEVNAIATRKLGNRLFTPPKGYTRRSSR